MSPFITYVSLSDGKHCKTLLSQLEINFFHPRANAMQLINVQSTIGDEESPYMCLILVRQCVGLRYTGGLSLVEQCNIDDTTLRTSTPNL